MRRTIEQKRADEALEEAVNACAEAYGIPGMVGDHLVVGAFSKIDDDGDVSTKVHMIEGGTGIPTYRAAGLLDHAGLILDQFVDASDDEG